MPMVLLVAVYNSAGEQVKTLFSGASQDCPNGFSPDATAFMAMSGGLNLNFEGLLASGGKSLTWMGDNDSGQAVGGGTYYVKAEMTDIFGTTQAWSHAVIVLPQPAKQSLNIYNSAGELVASLDASLSPGTTLTHLGFAKGNNGSFALGSGGGVDFLLQDANGAQVTTHWNGKSSSGATVSPGSYYVQLVDNSNGHTVLVSKGMVLLGDPTPQGFSVIAGPNPVGALDRQLVFALSGMKPGDSALLRLYSLAGELVSQGSDSAGNGRIVLHLGNWSSGVYVAVVECRDGHAVKSRKLIRIALQR